MMDPNAHLDPEWLSAYLDDEVSVSERALAERHLASCETCQQELAGLRHTASLFRRLPSVPLPRTFYVTEAMVAPAPPPIRGWQRWRPFFAPLGAVMAALLVLLVVVRPFPAATPEPAPAIALETGAAGESAGAADTAAPPAAEMSATEAEEALPTAPLGEGAERSVSDTTSVAEAEAPTAQEDATTLSIEATPSAPEAMTGTTAPEGFTTTEAVTVTPYLAPTPVPSEMDGVASSPPLTPTDPIVTTEETGAGGGESPKATAPRAWGLVVALLLLVLIIPAFVLWHRGRAR